MYSNSNSVISCIPSGTAWDIILKTINDNSQKDIFDDVSNWSNSLNTQINITSAKAKYFIPNNNVIWADISGHTTKGIAQVLTTGASEDNKKYNLYEISGNLWEVTSDNNIDLSGGVKLYRGTCAWDSVGPTYLPDYRGYWGFKNAPHIVYGFRVCLFLK